MLPPLYRVPRLELDTYAAVILPLSTPVITIFNPLPLFPGFILWAKTKGFGVWEASVAISYVDDVDGAPELSIF